MRKNQRDPLVLLPTLSHAFQRIFRGIFERPKQRWPQHRAGAAPWHRRRHVDIPDRRGDVTALPPGTRSENM